VQDCRRGLASTTYATRALRCYSQRACTPSSFRSSSDTPPSPEPSTPTPTSYPPWATRRRRPWKTCFRRLLLPYCCHRAQASRRSPSLFLLFCRNFTSRGGGTRTHTVRILSPLPLPIGLRPHGPARSITITTLYPLPRFIRLALQVFLSLLFSPCTSSISKPARFGDGFEECRVQAKGSRGPESAFEGYALLTPLRHDIMLPSDRKVFRKGGEDL
jgi:hypothetical protein